MLPIVMENLAAACRRLIPPPEHRPKREIEADIREEIDFHLHMAAERIVQEDRLSADEAQAEALRRFGDPEHITKQCTRIALKERIMLQRINTVLIALVAVGLIVVGIGTWQQQSQTAAAFAQINDKLTGLVEAQPNDATAGSDQALQNRPRTLPDRVFVYANPQRGGITVEITPDLTLATAVEESLANISPVPTGDLLVTVIRNRGRGDERTLASRAPVSTAMEFVMGDEIFVVGSTSPLPWTLYEPPLVDHVAIENATIRKFDANPSDPNSISLQRIFETAASMLELRLVMNPQDIEDYEYTLDVSIPRPFLESLTIGQALDYACLNVYSIDLEGVSWDIHDGMLIVGSVPFIASRATVTATYRIDDLVGPFPSRDAYGDLREVLTTAAGFDYWRDNGGDVSLYTEVEGRLSITTIPRFHRTITSILKSLLDPQQQYPRNSLRDEGWFQTWLKASNATIGSALTNETTVIEAVRHAFEATGLPGHIALNDLESIGFEGEKAIGTTPDFEDSAARLLSEWLNIASPDDFDRAGWKLYGGGIVVASERTLRQIRSVRVYDIGTLKLGAGDEFRRSITELIQTRVDSDGWRDKGGDTGIIQSFADLLIITTTDANHIEIVKLLNEYRANAG